MKTCRLFLVSFLIITLSMLTGWRSHRHHHEKQKVEIPTEEQTSKPKTLDLSLPLETKNKFDGQITQEKLDLTIEKPKKIQREIELQPQTIMSAEPEQDKKKSFDGAGFAINIKP